MHPQQVHRVRRERHTALPRIGLRLARHGLPPQLHDLLPHMQHPEPGLGRLFVGPSDDAFKPIAVCLGDVAHVAKLGRALAWELWYRIQRELVRTLPAPPLYSRPVANALPPPSSPAIPADWPSSPPSPLAIAFDAHSRWRRCPWGQVGVPGSWEGGGWTGVWGWRMVEAWGVC